MRNYTPDSWIERSDFDGPEPDCPECEESADRCECQPCAICGWRPTDCECAKCDNCGRSHVPVVDDGLCVACSVEWLAKRQLTYCA